MVSGVPSNEALYALYDTATKGALEELGATVIAVTARPVQHFMGEATQRRKPFHCLGSKVKDAGFKDAAIWWSCLDHFSSGGFRRAVLLSANLDYPERHAFAGQRSVVRHDVSALTLVLSNDRTESRADGIGWIRIRNRSCMMFDFLTRRSRLTAASGEAGSVDAEINCSPCLPGKPREVGAHFIGSSLGVGSASHEGRTWEKLHYSGNLTVSGPPIVVSHYGGRYEGSVSCAGRITGDLYSPFASESKPQLKVEVQGIGRTLIIYPRVANNLKREEKRCWSSLIRTISSTKLNSRSN
jgi:hypothetical protein